jgi:hypothetical protein
LPCASRQIFQIHHLLIALLAKFIDWAALQAVLLPAEIKLRLTRRTAASGQPLGPDKDLQLLNGPHFIPAASEPVKVTFDDALQFHFPPARPGDVAKNNTVYGRLYRCGERWRERPVLILLHGGGDFPNHRFRFPMLARCCKRMGFNAATLVLPNHFQRHHPRVFNFPEQDFNYQRFSETFFAQAVAEIRALTGWLLGEGCPAVALAGASYGGWLAGIDGLPRCARGGGGADRAGRVPAAFYLAGRKDFLAAHPGTGTGAARGL